jgi:hypothetical protein
MVTASTAVAPVEHKKPLHLIAMSLPSRMPSRNHIGAAGGFLSRAMLNEGCLDSGRAPPYIVPT